METLVKTTASCFGGGIITFYEGINLPVRKKILIITPFNPEGIGGAETFAKSLIEEAKKEHDIIVLTKAPLLKIWDNTNFLIGIYVAWTLLWPAICERRKFKYETVHCIGAIATAVGAVLKKLFKVKLLSTTLAIYDFVCWPMIKKMVMSKIFNSADRVFVEDKVGRIDMLNIHVSSYKIIEFMHWVDLERFKPIKYTHSGLRVLFVGRPIYKKGRHVIREVEKEFNVCQLKVRFTYVEDVAYKDLHAYYGRADIFVVPSLYREGVARVVLEAAASGCAVVASDYGSLRELVKPFGITIDPTSEKFNAALTKLYFDRKLLQAYKQTSRVYAMAHFSKKNAEVFLNEY